MQKMTKAPVGGQGEAVSKSNLGGRSIMKNLCLDDFVSKTANALLATTDAGPDNAFAPLVHLIERLERVQRPSAYRHNRRVALTEIDGCIREAVELSCALPDLKRAVMKGVLDGYIRTAKRVARKIQKDEADQRSKELRQRFSARGVA